MDKNIKIANKLRSSGLRPTKQRIRIAEFLFEREKTFHFTVEDLDQIINRKNNQEKISLATFYNTVHSFKKAGHLKEILTRMVSIFLQYFTTFPIKDSTNSFRLFSRKLLENIKKFESDKGFTLSFEITAKAHRLGYRMIEVPSVWSEREVGESRFKILSFLPSYMKWLIYIIKTTVFFRKK